jgi:hypothetical protein
MAMADDVKGLCVKFGFVLLEAIQFSIIMDSRIASL